MSKDRYESPLASRYASDFMLHLFSADKRIQTWRRLWVALARAEHNLGLPVTEEQVAELEAHITDIDYETAAQREKEVRHDVMAHVYTYGKAAPPAAGIIHLGATSCYVTDNADLVIYREGLQYLRGELLAVLRNLTAFAEKYKVTPTLGYTHYQPAQLVTVGKRATLWMQDLMADLEELDFVLSHMKFLGCRGTTGTEASFMDLFEGDGAKIDEMNRQISAEFGFDTCFAVCGQTYPRKVDSRILNCLSSIAQSCYRMANDIRLLQHDRQVEEPFEKNQIGSSAMAYKRNPMRSERICSLARYLMADAMNAPMTASVQWLGGRLRQPPHLHARGVPLCRRHLAPGPERHRRAPRQREGGGCHRPGVSSLHCHGEPDDGGRQAGRQPSGAPRDHPHQLHGRHRPDEGGQQVRPPGPSGRRARLRYDGRRDGGRPHALRLHRPLP